MIIFNRVANNQIKQLTYIHIVMYIRHLTKYMYMLTTFTNIKQALQCIISTCSNNIIFKYLKKKQLFSHYNFI